MAKCRCKVKFGPFTPKRSGYAAVMNASACQSILKGHAEQTKRAATLALGDDGYTSADGYKIGVAHGKLANGYYVRTYTWHAMRDNLLYNTLKEALR